MIRINLLEPKTREDLVAAPMKHHTGKLLPIVLINVLVLAAVVSLVFYLPTDTPVVGKFIEPAKIVLNRMVDVVLEAYR